MNLLGRSLSGLATSVLIGYRRLTVDLLRIEAAKCYLHGVRAARTSAVGLMALALVVALIGVGALLAHAALFVLLPWSVRTKAVIGLVLGLVYVIAGGVALRAAMNEQTWMKKSGATDMLDEATRPGDAD